MLKGKSASESGGLHRSLAERRVGAGWGGGVRLPLLGPTSADPGAGEGPREGDPQLRPPKASMFTPPRALLLCSDRSGDHASSKTPLSCPSVRGSLSPPGFLWREAEGGGGEGQNAVSKKILGIFFEGGE